MSHTILIIGAGAAGSVTTQKCAALPETFKTIHLASRRIESCKSVSKRCKNPIHIHQLDAHDINKTTELIQKTGAECVINMALPYHLAISSCRGLLVLNWH